MTQVQHEQVIQVHQQTLLLHSGVILNYQTILVGIKGPLRTLDWIQFVLK